MDAVFIAFVRDKVENGLEALGCPAPRAHANLTAEILPHILEDWMTLTNDENVLSLGERLTKERGARYGHPRDNWRRIGIKWQATLDLPNPIPPELVGVMMLDLKSSRLVETPDDGDSLDDIEGYVEGQRMLFR